MSIDDPMAYEDRFHVYFSDAEVRCPCATCKANNLRPVIKREFMRSLTWLRETIAKPFVVTSFIRCRHHNADVGGAMHSEHMEGNAVDILHNGDYEFMADIARYVYASSWPMSAIMYSRHVHVQGMVKEQLPLVRFDGDVTPSAYGWFLKYYAQP